MRDLTENDLIELCRRRGIDMRSTRTEAGAFNGYVLTDLETGAAVAGGPDNQVLDWDNILDMLGRGLIDLELAALLDGPEPTP